MSIFYLLLSFFLSILFAFPASAQVVLSEIMFDALGSESHEEFVEIVNLSDDDVDVAGWQFSDGTGLDIILPHQNGTILAPGQFAVIFDPSYFENSTVYDSLVPPTALLLTLDNTTFGSNGLSNSTAETVSLLNSQGDTVSFYTYSLGNAPGFSDEKIDLNGENIADNWKDSKTLFGTPGNKNSQSPLDDDLSFSSNGILISPEVLNQNENATISATIRNIGLNPALNFAVSFYADFNANGAPDFGEELISPITISEFLQPGDSTMVDFVYNAAQSGAYNIYAEIDFDLDKDTANNISFAAIRVGFPEKSLRINEVMYSPLSEQPEWIEFVNTSPDTINIAGWAISDDNLDDLNLINNPFIINPNQFFVISKDSSILDIFRLPGNTLLVLKNLPSLNNSKDSIILYDLVENVIDRVNYSRDWGGGFGISLEKITPSSDSNDSLNWSSAVALEGGTPGEKNSIFPFDYDLSISDLLVSPVSIKLGESATISATIRNAGLNPALNFAVSFYADFNANGAPDFGEELISPITISEFLQPGDSTMVDFVYNAAQSGAYNIYAEINFDLDKDTANNISFAAIRVGFPEKSLRINEVMYSPFSEQPEWIEFVNTSPDTINLAGWAISDDNLDDLNLINNPFIINPNQFFVISKDSSILDIFRLPGNTLLVLKNLPSLNNAKDSIILYDLVENVIDRVNYSRDWGGDFGVSLEKINPLFVSNDSLNWNSSVVFEGGTPGEINSIFSEFLPSNATLSIAPNPFSPDNDGRDDTVTISYNLPVTTALINIKIYDLRGRLIRYLANSKPTGADSGTIPAIVWDGKNDNGDIAGIGIYIVFLEALNAQAGVLEHKKKTVVLAGQL